MSRPFPPQTHHLDACESTSLLATALGTSASPNALGSIPPASPPPPAPLVLAAGSASGGGRGSGGARVALRTASIVSRSRGRTCARRERRLGACLLPQQLRARPQTNLCGRGEGSHLEGKLAPRCAELRRVQAPQERAGGLHGARKGGRSEMQEPSCHDGLIKISREQLGGKRRRRVTRRRSERQRLDAQDCAAASLTDRVCSKAHLALIDEQAPELGARALQVCDPDGRQLSTKAPRSVARKPRLPVWHDDSAAKLLQVARRRQQREPLGAVGPFPRLHQGRPLAVTRDDVGLRAR